MPLLKPVHFTSVFAAALLLAHPLHAQTMKGIDPDTLRINILSEVKVKSAGPENDVQKTGTGQLGISFKKEYFYGSVLFNVTNRNKDLTATDSTQQVVFANNLLIPENSGQGLSNFRADLGLKSFAKLETDWSKERMISWRRLGVNAFWQVNNTEWTKDTVTTPLFISSFGVNATYSLLSAQILNADKDNVHISFSLGWEARRLGGDYSLKKNEPIRELFLGTSNYAFNSVVIGATLEVGSFFGRIQHYNFGEKEQLDGFSGSQALISVGMNVEFNVQATSVTPNASFTKAATEKKAAKENKAKEREEKKKTKATKDKPEAK